MNKHERMPLLKLSRSAKLDFSETMEQRSTATSTPTVSSHSRRHSDLEIKTEARLSTVKSAQYVWKTTQNTMSKFIHTSIARNDPVLKEVHAEVKAMQATTSRGEKVRAKLLR